jgi:Mce-associated membrane protein
MASPRDRSRPSRRRIAGERSRQPAATPAGPPRRHEPTQRPAPDDEAAAGASAAPETSEASDAPQPPEPATTAAATAAPAETEQPEPGPDAETTPGEATPATTKPAKATKAKSAKSAKSTKAKAAKAAMAKPAKSEKARAAKAKVQATAGPRVAEATPTWALGVLAGLLVVALALDAFVVWTEVSAQRSEESTARALHSAVVEAPAAAERAAEQVLSYRYDTVGKDLAEARQFLTADYAPDYISSIKEVVAGPAGDIQANVQAQVLNSGVVQASGARSEVLLFVNQTTTTAAEPRPQLALNRVVFTMERSDRGWLVDEIQAF